MAGMDNVLVPVSVDGFLTLSNQLTDKRLFEHQLKLRKTFPTLHISVWWRTSFRKAVVINARNKASGKISIFDESADEFPSDFLVAQLMLRT